jgi:hypothetical protein
MNIQIKNIKVYNALSEETTCFTADVFVNGKKIAYAKNDGRGGSTYYNHYNREDRPALEAAEEFAKTLPSTTYNGSFGELVIESTLETIIDDAIDAFEKNKDKKKMEKEMEASILIGKPNGFSYRVFGFKGKIKLKSVSPESLQKLIDYAKSNMREGEVILNTNLKDLQVTL